MEREAAASDKAKRSREEEEDRPAKKQRTK